MIAYEDLRKILQDKMAFSHDACLEKYIRENSKDHKLIKYLDDYSIGDYKLEEEYIFVEIFGMHFGEPYMDDAGAYQDENGDSYDYPETEIHVSIQIEPNGISWEKP